MRQAEKTMANRFLAAVAMVSFGMVAHAEDSLTHGTIPAQTVVCVSRTKAEHYYQYLQTAPEFTANLLAQADCFQTKEPMDALFISQEKGFVGAKLLSGHTVWLPAGKVSAAGR